MGGWIRGNVAWVAIAFAFAALLWSEPAWASTRVALVVGNSGYDPKHAPELLNPVNDAQLMARSLETSGFEVQLVTDADQAAMKEAIKTFGKRLVEAGGDTVGLFYFAGHGVEDRGQNYLIPLGAEIESELDFHTDAVLMDWVLARMEKAGNRLNVVILDACRNNPLEGRSLGGSQGLAAMDAPSGSWIAYSASPNEVAVDGEGENSPYTAALAEALVVPGLKIEDVFKRVRVAVEEATNGQQTPWEHSSLHGDFYFVPKVEEPAPPEPAPTPAIDTEPETPTTLELAARAYEAAERVHTVSGYRLFVEQYPDTLYAKLAEEHIRKLEKAVAPPPPSPEEMEASLGLEPEEREQIQIGLWALGFNPGTPDGKFGSRSREAIRNWQASRGLETTGRLDAEARNALLAAVPDLSGSIWLTAQNKSCKVWNPKPEAGETLTWSGGCVDGKASGFGRQVWQGSYGRDVYEGDYRDGKLHGRGVYSWADGSRYEGEYRNGKRHGQGLMTYKNGRRYEGEWRENKRHGQGNLTFPSIKIIDAVEFTEGRDRYEGEFRDGYFQSGTVVYRDGKVFKGGYEDRESTYRGTITYPDDYRQCCKSFLRQLGGISPVRYEGGVDISAGVPSGQGIVFLANGLSIEATFVTLSLFGQAIMTWSDGTRYEGEHSNGVPHGSGVRTDPDGDVFEGAWSNGCFGTRNGRWATLGTSPEACGFK